MTNSTVRVPLSVPLGPSAPAPNQVALHNDAPAAITIDRSTLSASTASLRNLAASSVKVGASQLDGPVLGPGKVACAFSYGGPTGYAPLGPDCQPLP